MKRSRVRALVGIVALTLVVLLARSLAYALEPNPAARALEQRAGGPALPAIALVVLSLATALAIAICALASLAVRERALVETRTLTSPVPRVRVLRVALWALVLAVSASLAGGLLEAYIHWRAGIGWHGLHCVFGPVHRNLIPIESALSLVAAAIVEAVRHVAGWMRRTFARLTSVPGTVGRMPALGPAALGVPRETPRPTAGGPRAPPAFS
jgi:hypothetical protein